MLSSNPFTTKEMRREENHGFHIVDYTSKILIESRKTSSVRKSINTQKQKCNLLLKNIQHIAQLP